MSAPFVWQCIKGYNSFIRKGLNGAIFSAEPGNLANKHSYKHSGIANAKSVDISVETKADKTDEIKLRLGSVKNASKPKKYNSRYTLKKPARRILKSIGKQVSSHRPDLKNVAVARLSAIHKSLRVKKAAK